MPKIVLDTTLRELYRLDETQDTNIVLVNVRPTAEVQVNSGIPLSVNFAYQSPNVMTDDRDTLARLYLLLVPQIFGFIAGQMPLIIFDIENAGESHRDDAYRSHGQLIPEQRPQLNFVAKPSDIQLAAGAKIAISTPMDCLMSLPHAVDPKVHYDLLSKRSLALSGLPSPPSVVVDTILRPGEALSDRVLDAEIDRMTKAIKDRTLPFVVKTPQSIGGEGVFLIRDESERYHAMEVIQRELRRALKMMRQWNRQMSTSSIVLQDLTSGENVALSFFITRKGRTIFTSCCPQLVDSHGHWEGGHISYMQQERFRRKYSQIIEKIGQYIHGKGYYGPAGADVITDHKGSQFIIDMNIRMTASHPLGFLKNHFSVQRGLQEAKLLYPLFLDCRRQTFENNFQKQIREGSLIVVGWCHDKRGETSIASVILAAEDESKLRTFIDEVNVYKMAY
ncbi:MAG: hypothetical protein Q9170_005919 [Blastenia crenularia]